MPEVLAVAAVDPLDVEGRRRASQLLSRITSKYAGRVALSSRVANSIVTSLSEAEMVGTESRYYSSVLVLVASRRTARLVYDIGVSSERPVIIAVAQDSSALVEAVEAYNALRSQGIPATRPVVYPRCEDRLTNYMEIVTTLSRIYGSSLLVIGGVPSWIASPQQPFSELRRLLDLMILQLDLNDLVSRFEESLSAGEAARLREMLEARGIQVEGGVERALTLAFVLEKLALDNRASAIALNCREVAERLGDDGHLAAALLLESDSIPMVCDADIAAAATAALFAPSVRLATAQPVEESDEGITFEVYAAPLSLFQKPRISVRDGLATVEGLSPPYTDVYLARLDPVRATLRLCECHLVSSSYAPRLTLTLSGCGCVYDLGGRYQTLLFGREALEVAERLSELLGLKLQRARSTDTD